MQMFIHMYHKIFDQMTLLVTHTQEVKENIKEMYFK